MKLCNIGRFCLTRSRRQATFWKPKHYEAIPHYVKPHFIDIHDTYKLRSFEDVQSELSSQEFEIEIERVIYKPTDPRLKLKGRKAYLKANMQQFKLTELQMERFKVLVGCRYKEDLNELHLTCEQFDDF